jgi:hypothetical protein
MISVEEGIRYLVASLRDRQPKATVSVAETTLMENTGFRLGSTILTANLLAAGLPLNRGGATGLPAIFDLLSTPFAEWPIPVDAEAADLGPGPILVRDDEGRLGMAEDVNDFVASTELAKMDKEQNDGFLMLKKLAAELDPDIYTKVRHGLVARKPVVLRREVNAVLDRFVVASKRGKRNKLEELIKCLYETVRFADLPSTDICAGCGVLVEWRNGRAVVDHAPSCPNRKALRTVRLNCRNDGDQVLVLREAFLRFWHHPGWAELRLHADLLTLYQAGKLNEIYVHHRLDSCDFLLELPNGEHWVIDVKEWARFTNFECPDLDGKYPAHKAARRIIVVYEHSGVSAVDKVETAIRQAQKEGMIEVMTPGQLDKEICDAV